MNEEGEKEDISRNQSTLQVLPWTPRSLEFKRMGRQESEAPLENKPSLEPRM